MLRGKPEPAQVKRRPGFEELQRLKKGVPPKTAPKAAKAPEPPPAKPKSKLAGKIFRIGHLGLVSEDDIRDALDALAEVLPRVGYSTPIGR